MDRRPLRFFAFAYAAVVLWATVGPAPWRTSGNQLEGGILNPDAWTAQVTWTTGYLSEMAFNVALFVPVLILNGNRGVSSMFLLFMGMVVATDLAVRRTSWGRSVVAVGGNVEAARRAGINVRMIYLSVFAACSTFAAVGGILAAARLGAVSQSSGGTDTNLNAIAAAVIGGTSLFGGRGSAYSALLGAFVIMSISNGLALLSLDSSIRYMVTAGVLLIAVTIDSLSRRSRQAHGRA